MSGLISGIDGLNGAATSADDLAVAVLALEQEICSDDPTVSIRAIERLQVMTTGDADDEVAHSIHALLEDSALTLVPPLVRHYAEAEPAAGALLDSIARIARPREALMAFAEGLQIVQDMQEQPDMSEETSIDGEDEERPRVPFEASPETMAALLCSVLYGLANALRRIPGTRSLPTLRSLVEPVDSAITAFTSDLPGPSKETILRACLDLTAACWDWSVGKNDHGVEVKAICTGLLYHPLSTYGLASCDSLISPYFIARFPRFAPLGGSSDAGPEVPPTLREASDLTVRMGIEDAELVNNMIVDASSDPGSFVTRALAAFASVIILATRIAEHSTARETSMHETIWPIRLRASRSFEEVLPLLGRALCGKGTSAALVFIWEWVDQCRTGDLSLEECTNLAELLMPLAVRMPDQTARLAAFKLLGALAGLLPTGSHKISFLKNLLEEANPYEQIRAQSLSILRDEIVKSEKTASSSILTDELLAALPLAAPASLADPAADFLPSPICAFLTDLLGTLRVLYERDADDKTGIKSDTVRDGLERDLLNPVRARIPAMRQEIGGKNAEPDPDQAVLLFLVDRLADAVAFFARCYPE